MGRGAKSRGRRQLSQSLREQLLLRHQPQLTLDQDARLLLLLLLLLLLFHRGLRERRLLIHNTLSRVYF